MEKRNDDGTTGIIVLFVIIAALLFFIHFAFNIARGDKTPVRTSIVDTFDPTKNFESEQ